MIDTAVGLARADEKLLGVRLGREGDGFRLLARQQGDMAQTSWQAMCRELCATDAGEDSGVRKTPAVIGFDTSSVTFYRITAPIVPDEQMSELVRLQTESLLPLPLEQVQFAWRTGPQQDGKAPVTIVAARTARLERFVEQIAACRCEKVVLDAEAVVTAWRELFAGDDGNSVVVHIGRANTHVCFAERGRLAFAVTTDIGREDLSGGAEDAGQNLERLAQDIQSALDVFAGAAGGELPIFVLSDGSQAIGETVASLRRLHLNAREATLQRRVLRAETDISDPEVCEYVICIGLAIMAMQEDGRELGIFDKVYTSGAEPKKTRRLLSLKWSGALAASVLLVFLAVLYMLDVAELRRLKRNAQELQADTSFDAVVRSQSARKVIAARRFDSLDLLGSINAARPEGVLLNSVTYKKGQPVSITGEAPGPEKLYEFQEALQKGSGLSAVRLLNATFDEKAKKHKFTMSFNYKGFSKKQQSSLYKKTI